MQTHGAVLQPVMELVLLHMAHWDWAPLAPPLLEPDTAPVLQL